MSSVDNRAVHMTFDNASFEKNLAETVRSMDKLKQSLDFANAKKGFSDIEAASRGFNLGGMASSVEGISAKFLALGTIAVTTLANIVNRAVDAGINIAKSFTVAPIIEGFSDYNAKLTSVQTITNATGESLETVSGFFDQLDEYADKTVFNLSDMTGAFAKFTNAGISMDVAVPAIKGIANMTALAGQGADAAAIGMYNLSQSLAGGFLTTTDYKSLNLANIATKQWKDYMIEAAIAAGTLKRTGPDAFEVLVDGSNTAANSAQLFNNELSRGWASADILIDVLGDFGDTSTEIGKKAQSAAQDVKSLPMMFDTLKAAVGTGWTETFEILLGNLDESKELFTGLTTTIGGVLEKNSEWRNNLLQGWKDLGGRDKLIEGIKNAFGGLSEIMGAVKDAFHNIFPPATAQSLYDLTERFAAFTEKLNLSDGALVKLRGYFTVIFSVLKIGIEVVKGIIGVFVDLFKHFTGGQSETVTNFLDKMSVAIFKVYTALVKNGGLDTFFANVTNKLIGFGEALKDAIGFLADGFKNPADMFHTIIDAAENAVKEILSIFAFGDFTGVGPWEEDSPFVTKLFDFRDTVINVFDTIRDKIADIINNIFGTNIKLEIPQGVKDFFKNLFGNIDDNTSNSLDIQGGFERIGGAIQVFGDIASGAADAIGWIYDRLKDIAGIVGDAGGSILDFFENIGPNIQDFVMSPEFDKLLDFMQSMGVLMGGAGVGKIAKDGLGVNVDLTGGSLTNLGKMFQMITDMGPSVKKNIEGLTGVFKSMSLEIKAKALLKIAEAIGLITASVVVLSFIDPEALAKSLAALAVGFTQLIGAMALLNASGGPKSAVGTATTAGAMIAVASAVLILSGAVAVMAQLNWEEIGKGLTGITGLMVIMAGSAKLLQGSSASLIAAGVGMTAMAIALTILAGAMKVFAMMTWEEIGKGLAATAGGLLIMAGALQLMPATTILIGPGLLAVALALVELGGALLIFATMTWSEIGKGMTVLAGGLLIIAGAMNLMPTSTILTGPGLIAIATGLTILSGALKVFATMSWEEIGKAMTVLASSLLILAGAMALMSGGIPGAIAVGIMAGSLLILGKALKEFAKMSWKDLGKGLAVIGAALGALGLAALALSATGAIAAIFLLGVALLALGAGFALIGVGAGLLAEAFQIMAAAGTAGIDVFMYAIDQLLIRLPEMARAFSESIISMADMILQAAPGLVEKLGKTIGALLGVIRDNAKGFGLAATAWIEALLKTIRDSTPDLVKTGFAILMAFLGGIDDNVTQVTRTVAEIVVKFLTELAKNLPMITQGALDVVVAFLQGLTDNDQIADIVEAGVKFLLKIIEGITRDIDDLITAAIDIVQAFVDGIGDNLDDIIGSGAKFVAKLIEGIGKGYIDIAGAAVDVIIKFAAALVSNSLRLVNAAADLLVQLLDGLRQAITTKGPEIRFAAFKLALAIVDGMVLGLGTYAYKIVDKLMDIAADAWDEVLDFFGVHSPSKKFMWLGEQLMLGFESGMNDNSYRALNSTDGFTQGVMEKVRSSIDKIKSDLDVSPDFQPTITPVLDLTQVQAAAGGINGLLAAQQLTAGVSVQAANQLLAETTPTQDEEPKEEPVRALSFTQINNSPEALTTAVIYKRTRGQIEIAKKELENV